MINHYSARHHRGKVKSDDETRKYTSLYYKSTVLYRMAYIHLLHFPRYFEYKN